jgi:hypothetical protein
MKVVLIEFIDEFESLCEFLGKNNISMNGFTIVALELKLQAQLKERGVSYTTILPYFNNNSHKKIILESEKVMQHIKDNFKFSDINGLKNCYLTDFSHHVRFYLNHMLRIIEVLDNMREDFGDFEIYGCLDTVLTDDAMMVNAERFGGILAQNFAKAHGLNFTDYGSGRFTKIESSIKRRTIIDRIVARCTLSALKHKQMIFVPRVNGSFERMTQGLMEGNRKINFLRIDYSGGALAMAAFNIRAAIASMWGAKKHANQYVVNPIFLNLKANKDQRESLCYFLDQVLEESHKNVYEYCGVSYYSLLKQKIFLGIRKHMLNLLEQSYSLKFIFTSFKRRMLASYHALGVMGLAGELSRSLGIKGLFISHGSHPMPIDEYHEIELLNLCRGFMLSDYTHIALSTPVQKEHLNYFKNKYKNIKSSEVLIEPVMFARINGDSKDAVRKQLGLSPDDLVVMHATTTKARYTERYYFVETESELLSSLSDLVNAVNDMNAKLLIRLHPGFYLNDAEIRTLLPKSARVIIHRHGTFKEALTVSDLVVSYSSTVIDESLINKIPVILYDKWNRYNHFSTAVFENNKSSGVFPVCYVNDSSKLKEGISYVFKMAKTTKKEEIDVSKYSYANAYKDGLYNFVQEALS